MSVVCCLLFNWAPWCGVIWWCVPDISMPTLRTTCVYIANATAVCLSAHRVSFSSLVLAWCLISTLHVWFSWTGINYLSINSGNFIYHPGAVVKSGLCRTQGFSWCSICSVFGLGFCGNTSEWDVNDLLVREFNCFRAYIQYFVYIVHL